MPSVRLSGAGRELVGPLEAWSRLTAVSIAVIAVTGVISAIREIELFEALWSTTYGWLLAFKVGLVGLMLFLGNAGRLWVRRRGPIAVSAGAPALVGAAERSRPHPDDVWRRPDDAFAGGFDDDPADLDEPAQDDAEQEVAALRRNTGAEAVIAALALVVTTVLSSRRSPPGTRSPRRTPRCSRWDR